MQRTRAQWRDIVEYRLVEVYDAVIRKDHPALVIRDLHSLAIISEYYDGNCLAVDVWYLFDRRPIYAHRRFAEVSIIKDSVIRVLFGIVVQAIYDVKINRPCDAHSWRVDHPPGDGSRCSPTTHQCKKNAMEFIVETASVWESVLNLPYGTLMDLVTKENGSVRNRSQTIFNYIGQGS